MLLKINRSNIMGFFGKLGEVFEKIDTEISNDPQSVGKLFLNNSLLTVKKKKISAKFYPDGIGNSRLNPARIKRITSNNTHPTINKSEQIANQIIDSPTSKNNTTNDNKEQSINRIAEIEP